MAVPIPKGYTLDTHVDAKMLGKKRYVPFTIADLLEFAADLDPKTPVWINTYEEETDDVIIRPVEMLSSSTHGSSPYMMIG